jgi:hypothetical protein
MKLPSQEEPMIGQRENMPFHHVAEIRGWSTRGPQNAMCFMELSRANLTNKSVKTSEGTLSRRLTRALPVASNYFWIAASYFNRP